MKYFVKTIKGEWIEVPEQIYETYPTVISYYLMSKSEMTYAYAFMRARAEWTKKECEEND